jgi:hypothetical protein
MDNEKISGTQRDRAYPDTGKDDLLHNNRDKVQPLENLITNLVAWHGISAHHKHFKRLVKNLGEE